jgi:hypothetical protein
MRTRQLLGPAVELRHLGVHVEQGIVLGGDDQGRAREVDLGVGALDHLLEAAAVQGGVVHGSFTGGHSKTSRGA